jgi:type II secretory pathway component PulF
METSLAGLYPIWDKIRKTLRHWQFNSKAQLAFLEDFSTLINDGIPANRAIEMMALLGKGVNREVALSIAEKIAEGQALAEGMRDWFSISIVEIIHIGEEGGALAETTKSAIKTLSQRSGSMGVLISAITYPLLVISASCIVIIYLKKSVFVQFALIKPIDQWPPAGQQLVAIATLVQDWWWLVIIAIIAIIVSLRISMVNYVGELRPLLDKIPPFTLYRRFVASQFLETLGLLVANGVVFKNAIKVIQYQANPYLLSHLMMMEHLLGMGKGNVADVLSTGLISDSDVQRLRIMAEVKGFEHGLIRMGVHGSEQNVRTVKIIAKIVGGILLATGGILVILIARGIYVTGMAMGSA